VIYLSHTVNYSSHNVKNNSQKIEDPLYSLLLYPNRQHKNIFLLITVSLPPKAYALPDRIAAQIDFNQLSVNYYSSYVNYNSYFIQTIILKIEKRSYLSSIITSA